MALMKWWVKYLPFALVVWATRRCFSEHREFDTDGIPWIEPFPGVKVLSDKWYRPDVNFQPKDIEQETPTDDR